MPNTRNGILDYFTFLCLQEISFLKNAIETVLYFLNYNRCRHTYVNVCKSSCIVTYWIWFISTDSKWINNLTHFRHVEVTPYVN